MKRIALSVLLTLQVSALSGAEGAQGSSQPGPGRTGQLTEQSFQTWVEQRDKGVVKQSLDYSCGVAALATLMGARFDLEVSERVLLERLEENAEGWQLSLDWRERGVSLAILGKLAAHYNLRAIGVSVSAVGLMWLQQPAIAFIDYRGSPHFTVIRPPLTDGRIALLDPTWGNRTLTRWQFLPMFLSNGHGKLLLVDRM